MRLLGKALCDGRDLRRQEGHECVHQEGGWFTSLSSGSSHCSAEHWQILTKRCLRELRLLHHFRGHKNVSAMSHTVPTIRSGEVSR
jgi:hypothetical protein